MDCKKEVVFAGDKYGYWTVIKFDSINNKQRFYTVKCVCGKIKKLRASELRSGHTKSCGCRKGELFAEKNTLKDNLADKRNLYTGYKWSAKKRNHSFEISFEDFIELIIKNCSYCGKPPSNVSFYSKRLDHSFCYNGIDRVNNNIGYIKSNCITCCKQCNYSKREISHDEFLSWIQRVYTYNFINW